MRSLHRPPSAGREARPEHPTRTLLLDTARTLLESQPVQAITADMVLAASGVSKGSLYHHFDDFDDLMGSAMVREFGRAVRETIALAQEEFARCDSTESFQALIGQVHRHTQSPAMRQRRFDRISLVAFARGQPKLQRLLAAEQGRLTDAVAEMFAQAQERGWMHRDVDPRGAAVLMQAYSIGRIVDDIAEEPLDEEVWLRLLDQLARRVLAPPA